MSSISRNVSIFLRAENINALQPGNGKHLEPAKWTEINRTFVAADVKKDLKWLDQALKQI